MSRQLPTPELESLLIACIEGSCDEAQSHRMVELVGDDPAMLAAYVESMRIHAMLQWRYSASPHGQPFGDLIAGMPANLSMPATSQVPQVGARAAEAPSAAIVDTPSNLSGFISVHAPISNFASGWPVAYLLATVIFAIGLAIGALVHVSHPSVLVKHEPSSRGSRISGSRVIESYVARITGMVDCVWEAADAANQKSEIPNHKPELRLGDTLALRSGLLELTYNTGAKVILQGPVKYAVESSDGGYLSTGKVTARLEQRSEVRSQRPEPANRQSAIRNHTFAVRTPTAIVTDLGTEFGVEVSKEGRTFSHVFSGMILVQTNAEGASRSEAVHLTQNESIVVERTGLRRDVKTQSPHAAPASFVRALPKPSAFQRWLAYSRRLRTDPSLVAYYTFEENGGPRLVLPNQSLLGHELDAGVEGPDWVNGRFPGKFALYFHGPGSNDKVVLPREERFGFSGPFSLAVWFKSERFEASWQTLITKGATTWRLQRLAHANMLTFDVHGAEMTRGEQHVDDRRWHLAVATYKPEPGGDKATTRLYVDGRLDGESTVNSPLQKNDVPVSLGTATPATLNRELRGFIDEVAVFARALSSEEVRKMFQAGSPY